jgi:hypothetical protein
LDSIKSSSKKGEVPSDDFNFNELFSGDVEAFLEKQKAANAHHMNEVQTEPVAEQTAPETTVDSTPSA